MNLSSLRDWLFPMLMNGQVKVGSGYEGEVECLMAAEKVSGYGENSIIGNQSSE